MILLPRIEFIECVARNLDSKVAVFSTTGETSRELLSIKDYHFKFFPGVGGMGHISSIALGYAISSKNTVVCLDGDGSFLMHLGSISSITSTKDIRYLHILFDNGSHLSVGGNSTSGLHLDYVNLGKALGYEHAYFVTEKDELETHIHNFRKIPSSKYLVVIKTPAERVPNLPRPSDIRSFLSSFKAEWISE